MIWHTASGTYIGTFLTLTINIELVYGTYVVIFTLLMEKQYERVYGGVVPIYTYSIYCFKGLRSWRTFPRRVADDGDAAPFRLRAVA